MHAGNQQETESIHTPSSNQQSQQRSNMVSSNLITLIQFILTLTLFLSSNVSYSHGLDAYMYYEDAMCTGDNFISGTLIYEYGEENALYNLKGFKVEKYDGPCHYFSGGFYDFEYGEPSSGYYMSQGYCMICDGVVGCSPEIDSCHEFASIQPTYTDDDANDGNDANDTYYNGFAVSEAANARKIIKKQVKESNSKRPLSYLVMGAISMLVMLSIFSGSLQAVKKLRDSNMEFCKDRSKAIDEDKDTFEYDPTLPYPTTVV
jgi:hypothetical protein